MYFFCYFFLLTQLQSRSYSIDLATLLASFRNSREADYKARLCHVVSDWEFPWFAASRRTRPLEVVLAVRDTNGQNDS